ncbi:oxysterol-binding protein-related protein 8 isoform X2 [Nematostella vectensis]|uniref:oxysterol-binding protein-related protein 8 isoform X2 n=1 Tax=Nematostella vectensis TaxID=45351 RepID=UPI0020770A79|nr:oxysterol-binding protein-related protein 8 isoform X2 [Nematostella vectensis]
MAENVRIEPEVDTILSPTITMTDPFPSCNVDSDEFSSDDERDEDLVENAADTSLLANFSRNRSNDGTEDADTTPSSKSVKDDSEIKDESYLMKNQLSSGKMDKKDKMLDKNLDKKLSDRSPALARKQNKESLKAIKKSYRLEQKKRTKELSIAIKDPSVIILSSYLKIRGSLKGWAKFWCVVKPGMLIIYKSPKHGVWVGTVLLNSCELIERPSKKDGFCFKLYNPLEHYIWATKGPKGEMAGAIVQPMPKDHLILRALTESDGRCWMDALEVAQRQGYHIQRDRKGMVSDLYGSKEDREDREEREDEPTAPDGDDDSLNDGLEKSDSENEMDETIEPEKEEDEPEEEEPFEETLYVPDKETEYFGEAGEATEEIEDENKSILWALLKQVKPGMDLSRVTLPTFILEPRSFLDKLSDFYYHTDILSRAACEENPYSRMKEVIRWYLSGFYKKPKGLKKPYNPIIGEMFRCYWQHPRGSRTFFVSEQVSHHPPVSAFYVSNRQDGFVINGAILAKSKFYGNSSSAILDGAATLALLRFGEEYTMTMPYAHCKGILIGTLTMELGGTVTINCEKTGYKAEIEFKLKPFWKKSGESNYIAGKIIMGKETLCKIEGKWDGEIVITDLKASNAIDEEPFPDLFWEPTPEIRSQRLKRHLVDYSTQGEFESEKLWIGVSNAIKAADQEGATREKFSLEEAQRKGHRERKEQGVDWVPRLFERDPSAPEAINRWVYKYRDVRPWDPLTDLVEYENSGIVKTRYRLKAPMVRATSVLCVQTPGVKKASSKRKRPTSGRFRLGVPKGSRRGSLERSGCSTPDPEHSDSVEDEYDDVSVRDLVDITTLEKTVQPIRDLQKECVQQMRAIRGDLRRHYNSHQDEIASLQFKDWALILLLVIFQSIVQWWTKS